VTVNILIKKFVFKELSVNIRIALNVDTIFEVLKGQQPPFGGFLE
jgi:hypothetical protein